MKKNSSTRASTATFGATLLAFRSLILATLFVSVFAISPVLTAQPSASSPSRPALIQKLRVSENHRFLVREDGSPFFWLGDTCWELFHRMTKSDAEFYLRKRASHGFTVVQAVVIAELDGLTAPNKENELPLTNQNPLEPNEAYFKHVDWVTAKAANLGIYVAMLPTWGDKWNKAWGAGPEIFTPENAAAYGRWLGQRYKTQTNIVWVLGGDRPIANDAHKAIIVAMAKGLREGDGGLHLITFHPTGGKSSSEQLHNEEWLDFNMRQNGHCTDTPYWLRIAEDYNRTPIKPVLDGEPLYEDHPICFDAAKNGYSNAHDVRRCLYWDLFAGAFGHTYGDHSIWQLNSPDKPGVNNPLDFWYDALDKPGASQMIHARALLESRPFLTRVPDNTLVLPDKVPLGTPGAGGKFISATRDSTGSYAFVYLPTSRPVTIDTSKLQGQTMKAWWYNPRNGRPRAAGEFKRQDKRTFTPPDLGENTDWILVLDDVAQRFPPPGMRDRR